MPKAGGAPGVAGVEGVWASAEAEASRVRVLWVRNSRRDFDIGSSGEDCSGKGLYAAGKTSPAGRAPLHVARSLRDGHTLSWWGDAPRCPVGRVSRGPASLLGFGRG